VSRNATEYCSSTSSDNGALGDKKPVRSTLTWVPNTFVESILGTVERCPHYPRGYVLVTSSYINGQLHDHDSRETDLERDLGYSQWIDQLQDMWHLPDAPVVYWR